MQRYLLTALFALLLSTNVWGGGINRETHLYAVKGADSLYLDHYIAPVEGKRPCMMFVFGGGFAAGTRNNKMYDRLGLDEHTTNILGIEVPSITIPVSSGRNLSVVIEVAAMNNRQKRMGYNTAQEFNKRLMESMGLE